MEFSNNMFVHIFCKKTVFFLQINLKLTKIQQLRENKCFVNRCMSHTHIPIFTAKNNKQTKPTLTKFFEISVRQIDFLNNIRSI